MYFLLFSDVRVNKIDSIHWGNCSLKKEWKSTLSWNLSQKCLQNGNIPEIVTSIHILNIYALYTWVTVGWIRYSKRLSAITWSEMFTKWKKKDIVTSLCIVSKVVSLYTIFWWLLSLCPRFVWSCDHISNAFSNFPLTKLGLHPLPFRLCISLLWGTLLPSV